MGPAPALADYQTAANAIYAPQQAADITNAKATTAADIANLESGKGQINTDYTTAIQNLTSATNSNVAKINQLYTQRLGGNFSGLQGNDLGSMFGKAAQAQGVIESTRANKLAAIATTEANDQNTLNATIQSLGSKYQGLEAQYANTSYASAAKQYATGQYQQEQLALKQESLNISAQRAANAGAPKPPTQAEIKQADMATSASFLNGVVGKDGHVSQQNWNKAMAQWINAGYAAKDFVDSNMQFINQRYSGYHGFS